MWKKGLGGMAASATKERSSISGRSAASSSGPNDSSQEQEQEQESPDKEKTHESERKANLNSNPNPYKKHLSVPRPDQKSSTNRDNSNNSVIMSKFLARTLTQKKERLTHGRVYVFFVKFICLETVVVSNIQ